MDMEKHTNMQEWPVRKSRHNTHSFHCTTHSNTFKLNTTTIMYGIFGLADPAKIQ